MSKWEFFSLFWPAIQRVMSEKNVYGAFEKSGIVPFNPEAVLSILEFKPIHLPTEERPSSKESALSEDDWRRFRRIVQEVTSSKESKKIKKLENTVLSLHAKLAIIKAEN